MNAPVALISGASGVLGAAIVKRLAKDGYALALMHHTTSERQEAVEAWLQEHASKPWLWYQGSCADSPRIRSFMREVKKSMGPVSLMIHTAGLMIRKRLTDLSLEEWDKIEEVHLRGARVLAAESIRHMMTRKEGHCIFIGSCQAARGGVGIAPYVTAKAALHGMCKSLAQEYGRYQIAVNICYPGFFDSTMTSQTPSSVREGIMEKTCFKRPNDVEEVARFMAFLATTRNISGQVFNLDSRILPYPS
jgi:3-oxoacyl-[acyl-carrier protein] reductase